MKRLAAPLAANGQRLQVGKEEVRIVSRSGKSLSYERWALAAALNLCPTPPCAACGSAHTVTVAYGFPDMILLRAAQLGLVTLGGCVADEDPPLWQCRDCGMVSWPDETHMTVGEYHQRMGGTLCEGQDWRKTMADQRARYELDMGTVDWSGGAHGGSCHPRPDDRAILADLPQPLRQWWPNKGRQLLRRQVLCRLGRHSYLPYWAGPHVPDTAPDGLLCEGCGPCTLKRRASDNTT